MKPSSKSPEFCWMATANPTGTGTGERYFATNHEGVTHYRTDKPYVWNDACEIKGGQPVGK